MAKLDKAPGFEPGDWKFKSSWGRHSVPVAKPDKASELRRPSMAGALRAALRASKIAPGDFVYSDDVKVRLLPGTPLDPWCNQKHARL